jgi:hypothetical protein
MNKYGPRVLVLPEDDANRQLANGFFLEVTNDASMQILPPAGGWTRVLDNFEANHISEMDRFPERLMVLLIDFDDRPDRLEKAKARIPERLIDRVFIIGSQIEPEKLPSKLGSREEVGRGAAADCRDGTEKIWSHPHFQHNAAEVARLRQRARPILF